MIWGKLKFWEWSLCQYCNAWIHPEGNHCCAQYEEQDGDDGTEEK